MDLSIAEIERKYAELWNQTPVYPEQARKKLVDWAIAAICEEKDKEIAELRQQLAEATKPGRELTARALRAKAREFMGDNYNSPAVHAAVNLADWAIAQSKPQLCGPSAKEVQMQAWKLWGEHYEDFATWYNARFKPAAEYEKRIAELEGEVLPPDKCIANKLSREQIMRLLKCYTYAPLGVAADNIVSAIYGEQMAVVGIDPGDPAGSTSVRVRIDAQTAEAKEPTPQEIIDAVKPFYEGKTVQDIDDKIEALVTLTERLLPKKGQLPPPNGMTP